MRILCATASLFAFGVSFAACVAASPVIGGPDEGPGKPDATSQAADDASADVNRTDMDAASDATVPTDAGTDARRACNLLAEFSAPMPVNELNNAGLSQNNARITPGGLELYLTREEHARYKQVHRYTRATRQGSWGNDTLETNLTVVVGTGAAAESASSSLTFAGDTVAYLSVFQPGNKWDLFKTTRAGVGAPWMAPLIIPNISGNATNEFPWLNASGDRLYFMSSQSGGFRLVMSQAIGATFPAPTPLTLDAAGTTNQYGPVLSSDGTTLYFAGSTGTGRSIYKSTGRGLIFNGTVKDPTLNIGNINQISWISPDSCEVYLTVDGKIYSARKPL
jgi:WD40-like Beta Propeller Repeat